MRLSRLILFSIVVSAVSHAGAGTSFGQQPQQPGKAEDVVRVSTDLVQTDVMVFRKDGAFVDGLKREEFELKVNGKPREISFFERITAGSRNEEAQLAAARGLPPPSASVDGRPVPLDRGRAVFFFLDDMHLSVGSMAQARSLLTRFVDHEMGQNDEVMIASASGQVGFLQQLTNNKTVLHAAIERLMTRSHSVLDNDRPPMSEYQAEMVQANDRDVLGYFVDHLVRENIPVEIAPNMVRARATHILSQAGQLTTVSLASLDKLARSSAQLPGRKLIFFISDGFFVTGSNSDALDRMRAVTSAAARSGVVIYSIDARGLVAPMADMSTPGNFDSSGRLQRAAAGELSASQEALNALARDTGGRPFFNSNALSDAVTAALKETSIYYLVAWRPENEEERNGRFRRIDVNVTQRPELTVRLRRKFAQAEAPPAVAPKAAESPKPSTHHLRAALQSAYHKAGLPTSVAVNFLNLPNQGSVLAMTMQAVTDASVFSVLDGKQTATVGVAGAVLDDVGKSVGGFQERLIITATSAEVKPASNNLFYNYRVALKPGLYQVRVAAYDEKTGRTGSASEWIEVPDLAKRRLALSSVLAGERIDRPGAAPVSANPANDQAPGIPGVVRSNIDRRFSRASHLRFLVFVYNATNSEAAGGPTAATPSTTSARPDVAIQVQVLRDGEPVITTTLRKIETEGIADFTRLPYSAEIPLQDLPPGRYLLKVTVIDRIAKTSASQQLSFQVD